MLRVGLGEDQRDLGVVAERDPHLVAVQHPAAVGLARARLLVRGVRAGVGLGQPEAAEPLARAQLRQVRAASAPRCPSAGSTSTPATSGPRSPCASPSRGGRSPRRRSRRSRSPARRRRTRAARSRPGSPGRRSSRTSSVSKWWLRSFSRARSAISRSANVPRGVADELLLVGEVEVHGQRRYYDAAQWTRSRSCSAAPCSSSSSSCCCSGCSPTLRRATSWTGSRPARPRSRPRTRSTTSSR